MFKMKTLLAMVVASAFAGSVNADVLYSNGSIDGNTNGFQISSGYVVADTFSLSTAAQLAYVTFDSWDAYTKDVTAVDWTIFSAAGTSATGPTGTVIASGVQSQIVLSTTLVSTNSQGFVVEANTFALPSLNLAAGTYWLELANASTVSTADVYWDVNSTGTSAAWSNAGAAGAVSNSFQVSSVPLPGAVWLFATALAGFGAVRRKASKA
jgi:hypothetical protein